MVDRLGSLARESHPACNICGGARRVVLADHDRYGFPVRTALCLDCGLIYLAESFTPAGYTEFYRGGAYRDLSCAFNGTRPDVRSIQQEQTGYAAHAVRVLEGCIRPGPRTRLLDVGGSTGTVAREFAKHFGLTATVVDPAAPEIAVARAQGLHAVLSSLEDYQTGERFDVILLCRSIEHLCDLRGSLSKIRGLLEPGGLFYCDVVDYLESCRVLGAPQVVSKMDHCYWLCQETAPAIFNAAGLEVVSVNVSLDPSVVGYVLRRAEPVRVAPAPAVIDSIVRRVREIDADWQAFGACPRGWRDRLRRTAYQARRTLRRGAVGVWRSIPAGAGGAAAAPGGFLRALRSSRID